MHKQSGICDPRGGTIFTTDGARFVKEMSVIIEILEERGRMVMLDTLRDSILEIIERANECSNNVETDFDKGHLLAFNEVLSILKTDFTGVPQIEKVLDFDIDKRFMP